jgi:anaerobic selenocysteine-containing dehydrogenase
MKELARYMKASGFAEVNENGAQSAKDQPAPTPKAELSAVLPKGIKDWVPSPLENPEAPQESEFGFTALPKEAFEPYFLGPLLAEEAEAAFYPEGEVEMNPSAAFGMGLLPGDAVRVITPLGEWEGRLAMNPFLPLKVVASPTGILPQSMKTGQTSRVAAPAKVEKAGESTDSPVEESPEEHKER